MFQKGQGAANVAETVNYTAGSGGLCLSSTFAGWRGNCGKTRRDSETIPARRVLVVLCRLCRPIALLLAVDLSAHRKPRPISMRSAARWTAVWVLLGLSFSAVIYLLAANRYGQGVASQMTFEYLAGYLVEESLSIDNMFVFALLFRYFSLSGENQHRVLFYGIVGAMFFRGVFVAAGSALIQFHAVVIAFGVSWC